MATGRTDARMMEQEPVSPRRVAAFAHFFKGYMSLSSVVTASLPIPVTAFGLIPTYAAYSRLLSVYTSLFCFLFLGFIFYSRHGIARALFPQAIARAVEHEEQLSAATMTMSASIAAEPSQDEAGSPYWISHRDHWCRSALNLLPGVLILLSLTFAFVYQNTLSSSLHTLKAAVSVSILPADSRTLLKTTELDQIPLGTLLMVFYLLIFICAEVAFILMAIKEYLQDVVRLGEMDLIVGPHLARYADPWAALMRAEAGPAPAVPVRRRRTPKPAVPIGPAEQTTARTDSILPPSGQGGDQGATV